MLLSHSQLSLLLSLQVTQRDIVDWMNGSGGGDSVFVEYEAMMLTKITKKSFMMSIGKAIVRAGYKKNDLLSGRAFRWNLPDNVVDASTLVTGHISMEEGGTGGGD